MSSQHVNSQHVNSQQAFGLARPRVMLVALILQFLALAVLADDSRIATEVSKHFSDSVLPVLKKHCYECHSHASDAAEGGLVLDSRVGWQVGGDSGAAIIAGDAAKSLLMRAVGYSDTELQMPPDGKLSQRDIDILKEWIADGAVDPRVTNP
ncbi:MAG: hypothetical protein H8E66_30565, partial [Planctomycetes bacterium]|nr:hypothetical protein [Planctomycetota bacterium]